ncbi:MAG: hypothetical protein ABSB22_16825 [Thermodesulfobacteriota bacterium]
MAALVKEDKRGKWSSDLVLDLYSNLLMEIWEDVSALIGEAILELLFTLAIQKLGEKYPFLISLKVSENGIAMDGMKEEWRNMAPIEIHRGFQSLINQLSHLFSALAEGVINKELFPKVFPKFREAERIVSQK